MQERLSTRLTVFWNIFPIIIGGWLAIWILPQWWRVGQFVLGSVPASSAPVPWLPTIFFGGITVFLVVLCGSLKRVYLSGSSLIVRDLFRVHMFPLSEIESVEGPDFTSLRRIRINLKNETDIGAQIVFAPKTFSSKSVADRLRRMVREL